MKRLLFFLIAIVFAIQGWTQTPATLPYSCNFEDPNEITEWTLSNSTCVNRWAFGQAVTATGFSGTSMYISNDSISNSYTTTTVYTVTASRSIVSDGSAFYQLSFDFNCQGESSYDFVKVYVVPNDTNYVGASGSTPFYAASAFTSPRLVAKNGTKNYLNLMSGRQFYDIPASLMGASGTTVKLIFVWRNDGSGGAQPPAAIDNISFTSSNCTAPTTLAVLSSSITTSSADITWVADASNTGFTLEYKLQSQTWDDAIIVQSAVSPYSIQVLNPNTPYDVRVKADCSGSESFWSFTNFRTACGQINTLPFEESFDTYGTGTGVFLTCWGRVTSTPTTYPNISTTNSSSPGSMYMYAASGAHNYIATPEFDASIPINTLTAFFKLYKGSAAYNITVGVMSDPNDTTTFDSITNLSPTSNSTWQTFGVNFANYTGIGQYIAFKVQGFGAANGMYIDDLEIDISPVCSIPTGLTDYDSLATSNSITLDWDGADDANVLSWIVEYKPLDATIWQSQDAYSHPFVLTGLQSSVVYQVRLYAICSNGDTTYATPTMNVGMPCEAITTIPWYEGFESVWYVAFGLNTGTHPWCWTNINGGSQASGLWRKTTTSSYIHSGSGALQMYSGSTTAGLSGDWFISPTISLAGNERLRFWAKGYSTYTDILSVKILDVTTNGVVDAEADTSLFVDIMPNTIIPASDWIEYEINLNQYVGDYQIAFVRNTTGGYYLNIDDVSITELPNCIRPSDIAINSLESTSVTISWTPGNSTDASWYLYYKASTATDYDSILVSTNPYQLQGLNPNTTYNYYLRTDCGTMLSEATSTLTFTTPCDAVSVFPYTEGFDSLGAAGAFHPCWSRPVIYSTYPKTSTSASRVHSAPASLEIHSAVGSPTYAITPPMGEDINTLRVLFWAMAESITSSGTIEVGVMSDPSNLLTFESVQTIQPTNTSYNQYEVLFSGTTLTGMNRFIAFRQNTVSAIYYYWIDDIEVDYIPACSHPASVVASNITTTGADITWAPANATDNAWWLYYKTAAATSYDSIYITGTPTYSFTTLTANTLYNIYVSTDCGTELSEPTGVSNFRTACAAISTLPFFENFDTYGTGTSTYPLPNCWSRINTYTSSTMPYISTTNHSAPGCLYFYTPTSGTYNIGIMPPFDASIPINTLMAAFYYRNNSATDRLIIGAMSDPTDATTFDSITTITASATATWQFFEVNLSSYTGTGQYLAFKNAYTTANSYAYIDDLTISTIPTCPNTYSLSVASVTSSDVTLNWSAMNSAGQGWEVSYDAVGTGFDPSTGIIIPVADAVGVPPYTIPGLTPSTPYSFAVRQACGGNWSNIVTVNTMGLPAQLPYSCDFENVSEQNSWSLSNGGATNKWFIGTAVSATPITGNSLYISNDNGVSNAYTLTTISTVVASRLIEFDGAGGYTLTFDSKLGGESSFDYIKVYVVDQDTTFVGDASTPYYGSNSYSTGVVLFNGTNAYFNNVSNPTTVNNHSVVIPYQGVAGTVRKLMFVWRNDGGGGTIPPASIDNITITPITCAAPVLTISNIAQTTADASWTATATDAAWWLYWKEASATNYDSVYLTGTPSYSFTTLTANTPYNAYVRLDCGTELSNPSAIEDFRTACDIISTMPYIENFDTYGGTGSAYFPSCWEKITTYSTYPYLQTTNHSAPASLYFYASSGTYNIAILPEIDASIPVNTLMATFWMRKSNATSNIIVGVMDSLDASSFTPIDTVAPVANTTWEEIEVNFSSYTGTGQFIAFKSQYNTTTNYLYLDDVVIDIIPSCARPISATASNITGTTADLSWTPGNASDVAWKIYYRPSGTSDWDSVMVTNNPYNLTGLLASTNYEVGISTDCGNGEFSNMRLMNFRTQCGAITSLPWTDNFDSYGTGTTIFPGCWTRNTTYADRPYVHATSYSSPGSLYFYSATAGTYNIAATPIFDQTINISSVRASFMFRNMNATDTLKVGVMTDPSQESTWVEVGRVSHSSEQVWVADTISFANYTGTGQYIAFRIDRYSTTSQWSWMDDLVIEYDANSNPCPQPTNVVVTPSNISATVTWSAGAESAWEVRLGETGTPTAVSNAYYTIPGLSTGTPYTVYVRSNCGTGYSAWVSVPFTTTTAPTPPSVSTTVPTTQITQTTAVFNGTYLQGSDTIQSKGFEYKKTTDASWTDQVVIDGTTPFTYTATNLSASTEYKVKSYVTTATDGRVYGDTITFTTLAIIPPTVTTDSVRNVSQTSATFYGTITANTEQIEARGFEYKLSTEAWADAIIISATGVTNIYASPTTLQDGRTYNVRAYGRTLSDTSYGQTLTFSTLTAPTVTTTPTQPADVQSTSATLKGTVTSAGNALPSQVVVGFVYSTTTNPVIGATGVLQAEATYSTTDPNFTTQITELASNTNYFFKAYITNPVTTAYGNEANFITLGLLGVDGKEISIMMYPNPATSQTNLIVEGVSGETKIVLSDVQGRILNTINTKAVNGVVEQTIDLNNLAKGVYYIRIQNSYINRTQKLIVK